jgi:hypothetical protein
MVLPRQRRHQPSTVHQECVDGEARRLDPRRVAPFAATEVGVSHHRPAPPGDTGLGAPSIIANFHHRRIVPLTERELCIFEMGDAANPMLLARSRLLHERFPREYAATQVRHVINLKVVPKSDDDLWSFVMCRMDLPGHLHDAPRRRTGEHSFFSPCWFLFRIFYSS